jgi:hypothetical protein
MGSIQVALSDAAKANALRVLLARTTQIPVLCAESPDCDSACAVVIDAARFAALPRPLKHPDRIVLITTNEPERLKDAWDAGVQSVLSEQDPLNTVVLAVLATCLRSGAARCGQDAGNPLRL